MSSPPGPGRSVEAWLLQPSQPSIRALTLTDLLDRPKDDPVVRRTVAQLPRIGWGRQILEEQRPDGSWVSPERLYTPKYRSTNWKLLVLADLGFTREDPRIDRACRLWMRRFAKPDGGFGGDTGSTSHLCVVGNAARALIRFGYLRHPKVVSALDWLLTHQAKLGGWSCWGSGRNLDSWEGLSALAEVPRSARSPEMDEAIRKGAEFFLSRELRHQGSEYPPWYRFHYPVHYYYDLLVGLDLLTELGYGQDPRLAGALQHLRDRRRPDGRWVLDAIHPDVEGPTAEWFARHPKHRPDPWGLETVGRPSKMITLRALRVLRRVEGPPAPS